MVSEPPATAVASPVADTVPTVGSLCAHVTTRPCSTPPAASQVAAVNCTVPPTTTSALTGSIVTAATGADGSPALRHMETKSAQVTTRTSLPMGGDVMGPPQV